MRIGDRIRIRRKALSMTQKELGDKVCVSRPTIVKYESGEIGDIPMANVQRLAVALDCDVQWLLGWSDLPGEKQLAGDTYIAQVSCAMLKLDDEARSKILRLVRVMYPEAFITGDSDEK